MKIGGFTKQSFIDWEGKVVAVIFTKGCNFRCGYCHNPSLVLPELFDKAPDVDEEGIFTYLASRQKWLDGVVVTGGEPTIHKDLCRFLQKIKEAGFRVKLDTNGSNPSVLEDIIGKGLVDFIAMDIKTIFDPEKYNVITGTTGGNMAQKVCHSLQILRSSPIAYQLRTTVVPDYHSPETINTLTSLFKTEDYVLQQYRPGGVLENFCS